MPTSRARATAFLLACLWWPLPGCGAAADTASEGIVFVRAGEKSPDLWRARVSDGATRKLTDTPEREERWPFWSSDAGLLVFEVRPVGKRRDSHLLLFDPETGRERPLLTPDGLRRNWAAWAPTGTRLVFAFHAAASRRPNAGIGVLDVQSGERARMVRTPASASAFFRPELAPDGGGAVAQRSARGASELWLLAAGSPPTRVTGGNGWHATKARFTRDGQWIVFTRQAARNRPGDVMLIRPDGTGLRALAADPESDDHTARASPTRDEIVFVSDRDGQDDLFLTDVAGGEPRNLTRAFDRGVGVPRWSPDGERIVSAASPPQPQTPDGRRYDVRASEVIVIDRSGEVLLRTSGYSPDFLPAWR